jgi:hypothetical protein
MHRRSIQCVWSDQLIGLSQEAERLPRMPAATLMINSSRGLRNAAEQQFLAVLSISAGARLGFL